MKTSLHELGPLLLGILVVSDTAAAPRRRPLRRRRSESGLGLGRHAPSRGAEVLARCDHHFFDQFPGLTRNAHGQGTLTWQGTVLSDALQEKVLLDILDRAGLTGPDQVLPAPVRLRQGVGREGRTIRYHLNFSREPQSFDFPHAPGTDLLTDEDVATGRKTTLAPWDLAIIEEN